MSRLGKIRWQCRRGKLELDIILQPFADTLLPRLTATELDLVEGFLQASDEDLLAWLSGREDVPDSRYQPLVQRIRDASTD